MTHSLNARTRQLSGYLSEDTICAVSTQIGGAIVVVRVSGPEAFSSLSRLIKSPTSPSKVTSEDSDFSEPRKMIRSYLYSENGEPIDDALYVRFVRPYSYTGEDLVEYHLHGGTFIASQLMETLINLGMRQALPGEFSFRAVRNGKMTLFQAQAVVDLLSASNSNAISLALEKMSGAQVKFLDDLAGQLRHLATLAEVGIDFSDQDIEETSLPHLKKKILPLIHTLETLKSSFTRGSKVQEGIHVAFLGLPNAGKSSFFNALLGEDRSIVSEYAGTTRDIVREKITLRGKTGTITLRLSDTAGLRKIDEKSENSNRLGDQSHSIYPLDPIEKIGIERAIQTAHQADILLFIVDPVTLSEPTLQEQWQSIQKTLSEASNKFTPSLPSKVIGIFSKSDLYTQEQLKNAKKLGFSLGIHTWIFTSTLTNQGISEAIESIIQLSEEWTHRQKGEILLTRLDHLQAIQETLEHLLRAQQVWELELFASDIRQALYSLGPLIGETLPDDILTKIFSDFCIGK